MRKGNDFSPNEQRFFPKCEAQASEKALFNISPTLSPLCIGSRGHLLPRPPQLHHRFLHRILRSFFVAKETAPQGQQPRTQRLCYGCEFCGCHTSIKRRRRPDVMQKKLFLTQKRAHLSRTHPHIPPFLPLPSPLPFPLPFPFLFLLPFPFLFLSPSFPFPFPQLLHISPSSFRFLFRDFIAGAPSLPLPPLIQTSNHPNAIFRRNLRPYRRSLRLYRCSLRLYGRSLRLNFPPILKERSPFLPQDLHLRSGTKNVPVRFFKGNH